MKRFNKIFGIQDSLEAEQKRFVNRINQTIFNDFHQYDGDGSSLRLVCYALGVTSDDHISAHSHGGYGEISFPHLRTLTRDEFIPTLQILTILHRAIEPRSYLKDRLESSIQTAFNAAQLDLGVRWKDGMFYPSGVEQLDIALIEDPYQWLDAHPEEKTNFKLAIESLIAKKYNDVAHYCYLTMEGFSRKVLNNGKRLDDNKDALLSKLGLSKEWSAIFAGYLQFMHEYGRHASEKRANVSPAEAEAALYQTGLLLRLILKTTT